MEETVPAIGRPSGESPHASDENRLCATSSGSSSCMAISSRITSRSASTSSAVRSDDVTMSPSTSTASGRSSSRTRAWKQVYSLAVKALNSPPTASSAMEISSADRSGVPLNSRCSRKWEHPCRAGDSSREPTPTQTPMVADLCPGTCSLMIRSPLGRTVRRTTPPSSFSSVRVVPAGLAAAGPVTGERPAAGCRPVVPVAWWVMVGSLGDLGLGLGRHGDPRLRPLAGVARGLLDDWDQRQLAAIVDLADLDLDLLADRDDVLDVLHPLATHQGAELGDVQQAVLAREEGDEGTEVRRLHHRAEVALADLGHGRVGDRVDSGARRLGRLAIGGTDVDGAVVLDRQAGAGVVLDLVDHLALGADDLPDLVDRHLDDDDPWRVERHLLGGVDRLGHHLEDRQSGVLGLVQRLAEHLGRNPVELGVELERGDELAGAGDLEVHVTEGVLGAEDVCQRDVLRLAVDLARDQAHCDAGDGRA